MLFENLQILKEQYVGKSKDLLKCESLIDTIMTRFNEKTLIINNMREVEELESLLKKVFGFSSATINFYHLQSVLGARGKATYGYVTGFKQIDPTTVKKTAGAGKSFMADANVVRANVNVCTDFVIDHRLTAGEVLALILQEFGSQSSATAASNFLTLFNVYTSVMRGDFESTLIKFSPAGGNLKTNKIKVLGDAITSIPPIALLSNIGMRMVAQVGELSKLLSFLLIPLVNPITALPITFITYLSTVPLVHYVAVNTADTLPTKYGYGPELASALRKSDLPPQIMMSEAIDRVPLIRTAKELGELNLSITASMLSGNPQNITRITNQIKNLEKDLADPTIPASYKNAIKKDIATIKNMVESDVIKATINDENKAKTMRAIYYGMIYKMGGSTNIIADKFDYARL